MKTKLGNVSTGSFFFWKGNRYALGASSHGRFTEKRGMEWACHPVTNGMNGLVAQISIDVFINVQEEVELEIG